MPTEKPILTLAVDDELKDLLDHLKYPKLISPRFNDRICAEKVKNFMQ